MLVLSIAIVGDKKDNKTIAVNSSTINEVASKMKAIWVSYITLSMENTNKTEEAFRNKIDDITDNTVKSGFNTLVFQVRPFCDALYKSSYYPWSHILSGEQGQDVGYDPLKIICDICHQKGLNVHAWINPYRVSTEETPHKLSEDNPYVKDKRIGFEHNGCVYLDPSNEKAQKLIINGVAEIVRKYDVDGIQFDDYFYPSDCESIDEIQYNTYKESTDNPISKEKWRMQNVNTLIKGVHETIHKINSNILFGISPQGNISNNKNLGADVYTWCQEEGYIDYICPQIYFSLDNPQLSFEQCLEQWEELDLHKNLLFYVGLAGYKGGTDADEGTWLDNNDILKTQIEIIKEHNLDGIMLYCYESLSDNTNKPEITNVINYITDITQE